VSPARELNVDSTLLNGTQTAREAIFRVPPSETIGDTRVRAAPYRLLSTVSSATTAQIDGRGRQGGGPERSILGRGEV